MMGEPSTNSTAVINSGRLRVAWFSPLPVSMQGNRTRSAYTSQLLLPLLRNEFDIELFHDGVQPYNGFPTWHYLCARERHYRKPFDLWLYQFEDCAASNFVRFHCALQPGIVWFHDFVLCNDGPEPLLNSGWESVIKNVHASPRVWPSRDAEFVKRGPAAYREFAFSVAALFSNPVHCAESRSINEPSIESGHVAAGRNALHLPVPVAAECFAWPEPIDQQPRRICYCGSPWIEHRSYKVLQAFADLPGEWQLDWLLQDGEQSVAQQQLEDLNIHHARIIAPLSAENWMEEVQGASLALHTLFSVHGSVDPFLGISLAAGVPSVVTRFGAAEYLPDSIVFKIEPGETEACQLRAVLQRVLEQQVAIDRDLLRSYAFEHYHVNKIASELMQVLRRNVSRAAEVNERWCRFEADARRALFDEMKRGFARGDDEHEGAQGLPWLLPEARWELLCEKPFQELGWCRAE